MYVGHYGPALIGKAVNKNVRLWHLFIAVQLVDIAWSILILAGIEQARIVPGFMEASDLDLFHMPYTHSLVATGAWMFGAFLAYRFLKPSAGWLGGLIIALAVGSHWLTDLIVHTKDLPIMLDGPKVGFGLWNSLILSQAVEIGILAAGLFFYLKATKPRSRLGQIAPWILLSILILLQTVNHIMPPPTDIKEMAPMALASYLLLAAVAALSDIGRVPR